MCPYRVTSNNKCHTNHNDYRRSGIAQNHPLNPASANANTPRPLPRASRGHVHVGDRVSGRTQISFIFFCLLKPDFADLISPTKSLRPFPALSRLRLPPHSRNATDRSSGDASITRISTSRLCLIHESCTGLPPNSRSYRSRQRKTTPCSLAVS